MLYLGSKVTSVDLSSSVMADGHEWVGSTNCTTVLSNVVRNALLHIAQSCSWVHFLIFLRPNTTQPKTLLAICVQQS